MRLTRITGQKLNIYNIKEKDVASVKDMPIGAKVTLRGKNMSFR
jgi:ribosomal protein L5